MHVLHLIDGLGLGGAERMLVDLANASVRSGLRVSVCVTRSEVALASDLDREIELLVLHRRSRFDPLPLARLAAWIRRRGIDVLHVHMRSTLALVLMLRAIGAIRTPIVFHDHYGSIEVDRSVPAWFRLGHRLIAHYVGVSEPLRAWAQSAGMPAERTTVIENRLDLARLRAKRTSDLRAELELADGVPLALLVASFKPEKGIDHLIAALAQMRDLDLHVAIAGGGTSSSYAETCRAALATRGLTRRVHFLGARADVPALLTQVDVGLLASHSESGPLVLIEYLVAGLPIVATRVGQIGRALASRGIPGFVEPHDVAAFAAALDEVLALSPAERQVRGRSGKHDVERGWDIDASLPHWNDVYRRVLEP